MAWRDWRDWDDYDLQYEDEAARLDRIRPRVSPGKRTLTSRIIPVQRKATPPVDGADREAAAPSIAKVRCAGASIQFAPGTYDPSAEASQARADGGAIRDHEIAQAGINGPSTRLPHAEQIQRAFAKHDVSGVRAHLDDDAAEAAETLGAAAYATGMDVAFAGPPSLHTAAHEAAHVVQQRAGVQLAGGFGESGDAYERHADEVADAVVAGQSAEPILSRMAGQPAAQPTAVQRSAVTTPTNGAVQFDKSSSASAHRAKGKPTPHDDASGQLTAKERHTLIAAQKALENARSGLVGASRSVKNYFDESVAALRACEVNLSVLQMAFDLAWATHVAVLQSAKKRAAEREEIIAAVFGGLTMLAGATSLVLPEAIGLTSSIEEVNALLPSSGGLLRDAVDAIAGGGSIPGADQETKRGGAASTSLDVLLDEPSVAEMQSLDAAARLLELARLVLDIAGASSEINSSTVRALSLYMDVTTCLRDGKVEGKDRAEVLAQATETKGLPKAVQQLVQGVENARLLEESIAHTKAAIETAVPKYGYDYFLHKIWIEWMAHLRAESIGGTGHSAAAYSRTADVLDEDPIEDHLHQIGVLGQGSDLGVDFEHYTSDRDENHAVWAAQHQAFDGRIGRVTKFDWDKCVVIKANGGEGHTAEDGYVVVKTDLPDGTMVRLHSHGDEWSLEPVSDDHKDAAK